MNESTVGIKNTKVKKHKIEAMQADIKTKEKQFKRMKFFHPLFTWFMRAVILNKKKATLSRNRESSLKGWW